MPTVTAELVREKDLEKALTGHKVAGVCEVTNGKDKMNGKEITMEFRKKSKSTNTSMLEANFTDVCLTKVIFSVGSFWKMFLWVYQWKKFFFH